MIVVADASPLRYLILIEHAHVLPALYGYVLVPPAVITELTRDRTPDPVRRGSRNGRTGSVSRVRGTLARVRQDLGDGEREAIDLAVEMAADALLVDDRDARHEAQKLGVAVLGTLRVLADASEHGFADLAVAFVVCDRPTSARATSSFAFARRRTQTGTITISMFRVNVSLCHLTTEMGGLRPAVASLLTRFYGSGLGASRLRSLTLAALRP